MGLFITFEGIEGCGKTTQIQLLDRYFQEIQLPCRFTREPGGTSVGESIRNIFLHSANRDITPDVELLLVTAARVQHIAQVIEPALDAGAVVVCDRFFDATAAYQGYAGGVPLEVIRRSHELFCHALRPGLTVLLDCSVEAGLFRSRTRNRQKGTGVAEGRFEDMAVSFHEKVRRGYLTLAEQEPERFCIINAEEPVEAVQDQVRRAICEKLREAGYVV